MASSKTSTGTFTTKISFLHLSNHAAKAITFKDFSTSLKSVGKTADDGNVSIYTKDGVSVHKEQDVLTTC